MIRLSYSCPIILFLRVRLTYYDWMDDVGRHNQASISVLDRKMAKHCHACISSIDKEIQSFSNLESKFGCIDKDTRINERPLEVDLIEYVCFYIIKAAINYGRIEFKYNSWYRVLRL